MPKLLMLVGIAGSGKDTFVKNVLNHEVLSTDQYVQKIADESRKTFNEVFSESIDFATSQFNIKTMEMIKNKESFVWNQMNIFKKSRLKKLKRFPKDYEKICIYFDTPLDILLQRNEVRRLTNRHLRSNLIEKWYNQLEVPTIDEGFDYVYTIKGE